MWNNKLENIFQDYLAKYEKEKIISFKSSGLRKFILKEFEKAKKNYSKLIKPTTCSLDIYIAYWIREEVLKDFSSKTVHKAPTSDLNTSFSASIKLYDTFPPEKQLHLRKQLYDTSLNNREEVWKNFDLPIEKIEKIYKKVIEERINFARNKGYVSYIDMQLDTYGIPKFHYEDFLKNIDGTISYAQGHLNMNIANPEEFCSVFNNPCYICQTPSFPDMTLSEIQKFVVQNNELLKKYKAKIKVKSGNRSEMKYIKEKDRFEVVLSTRINGRHKIVDLIHELSHVVVYLNDFSNHRNPLTRSAYEREKDTLNKELSTLKKLSKPLYRAVLYGEPLLLFRRILFEDELYKKPNQNISKLYASTFNRCFPGAKQIDNPLYLMDEFIMTSSFLSLKHAIAHAEELKELIGI